MAGKGQTSNEPKKRKHINDGGEKSNLKKVKLPSKPFTLKPHFNSDTHKQKSDKFNPNSDAPDKSRREQRLQSKKKTEARKKKRNPHYTLEQELALLWEKMRRRNIAKEDRSKFVSEALRKMKGKIHEIASSHVSSRVLQTCIKHCSQSEKDVVFNELRPHFLTLACNTYSTHVVKKLVDSASKNQLSEFISLLHGNVASLLRNTAGSVVVEQAYHLGNAAQKQALLSELYSPELKLFKDLVSTKESKLEDIITKLGLQKVSVLKHMNSVFRPILEKGIVDHSIIQKALLEFFSIADKASAVDVIRQLSTHEDSEETPATDGTQPTLKRKTDVTQPLLLVRMIHTREGSKIVILCLRHSSAKERKLAIKGLKSHVHKAALCQYGSLVLAYIFSIVDDTKLVAKVLIKQLLENLKENISDKSGRRPVLQLLHPNCSRYFSPDELASFNLFVPSLLVKQEVVADTKKSAKPGGCVDLSMGGKKDPLVRRRELLVDSGLAEALIDTCIESAGDLLRSNFGKDILYEVATGGADNILRPSLDLKLDALHEAIASLAAQSKHEEGEDGEEEEHLLENFHSSRTIRKLVLDSPAFASTLWKKALAGKCELWAQGHSSKVLCAYLESTDSSVREMAREHLQPLVDAGTLKLPNDKPSTKQG